MSPLHSGSDPVRRRRSLKIAALAVVCLLATVPTGAAAPEDNLPDRTKHSASGPVTSTQIIAAQRAKMNITIGPDNPMWGLLYYGMFDACKGGSAVAWCPIGQEPEVYGGLLRVPWPFEPLPDSCVPNRPPEERTQYVRSQFVILSPEPQDTPEGTTYPLGNVGAFPAVEVNLLAFGSIPATVTLQMSMTRQGKTIPPWTVHVWNPTGYKGPPGKNCAVFYRTLLEGQVDIRLDDLEVDGQPVDLGPNCRTSRPVDIALWGEQGYQALAGGYLSQRDGHEKGGGTITPLRAPFDPTQFVSPYHDDEGRTLPDSTGVDIPPFEGCGAAEDLDPLVTAMASGPNNPLRVHQGTPGFTFDPDDLALCFAGRCPLPAPETPDTATPSNPPPDQDW
ncbi:hypothetical protein J2S40_002697 [Nocardioides luteus]|uniref:Secreted protein n=1 Tax=Nocardioides luteus TaxID=1844 RepID=A0ABQ5T489_9ACTN|nr:hypothetical protein [Nocardioides luteus]MDR7311639.1 hypothetical protein [Nocardioides luteus]GGR54275.1 hypothetical protein GCM10010197_20840 [Nocardioides luteus]GLJ70289.1 hypothetical protein GCM10017579_43250 [Nocardioides luteus]